MSNNLRSVLGMPRVQKKKKKPASTSNQSFSSSSSTAAAVSSSWTSSLPRTKPASPGTGLVSHKSSPPLATPSQKQNQLQNTKQQSKFEFDLDVPQCQRYTLARMFEPIPERSSGMNSVKIAQVLNTRKTIPPVNSTAHLQALLLTKGKNCKSPTAVERELTAAVTRGVLRRIVLPERKDLSRRGGKVTGDLVILEEDLERMVWASGSGDGAEGEAESESGVNGNKKSSVGLGKETKEKFVRWLKGHPAAQRMVMPSSGTLEAGLSFKSEELDALVRAGFLTAVNDNIGRLTGVYARPEDRSSMLSLEAVSRAAAGSIAAVGGDNALHDAGGTGGARNYHGGSSSSNSAVTFCVAVPGAGLFLKLVSGALERVEDLFQRAQDREMPVDDLREKWDGGIAGDRAAALAKKARGEFVGILPGRTKKWKDFYGLSFDWILQEAVGVGLVEVFETGSVGLGVRLLT